MPIEIFPKQQSEKKPLATIMFTLSIILFVAAALAYGGLWFFSGKTSGEIAQKKKGLEKTEEEFVLENRVIETQNKINAFRDFLSRHRNTANILGFMEQKSHPGIWFDDFKFDASQASVSVSGVARDFIAIEQQRLIFTGEKLLKSVNLSGISLSEEEGVSFNFSLVFDPQIFNEK